MSDTLRFEVRPTPYTDAKTFNVNVHILPSRQRALSFTCDSVEYCKGTNTAICQANGFLIGAYDLSMYDSVDIMTE